MADQGTTVRRTGSDSSAMILVAWTVTGIITRREGGHLFLFAAAWSPTTARAPMAPIPASGVDCRLSSVYCIESSCFEGVGA
ncbi:hypothetical protein BN140_1282 [Methanoculleus bourgensis MS2]|uniref:Uncharacterized protein n=1 Tax=Methanoculleus bourgensis (strain ATCC 43281 / DSM 3045 / OCM 15 / MS2) TaxID=1201294 RepID=I7KZC0_METBM|nr:hypothetical protein BN140_1282 [Methanoculleus bourgensis MS2]